MQTEISPPATPDTAYHYRLIARAITVLDQAGPGLTLDALAAQLDMSPAHFQRVFSQWVGVSPKRYQQYLTLDHARRLLAARQPLLEAAHATGLSGPSRLHDLFLRWEAMTPGEYARRGAGLTIRWGWGDSPFGPVLAMATDRGLCGLGFAAETGTEATLADLSRRWPAATLIADRAAIAPHLAAAFGPEPAARLHLIGPPFQIKVWEALLTIPPASVTTYGDIAARLCTPRAARAVGAAVGRNPVSWLIPCHRVLAGNGALTGYHWGLPVKRAMLAWEAARADAG